MPGPVPYTYAEGGGKLPRYGEDFFQRIVGVHWRKDVQVPTGGVFVAGTNDGSIFYLRVGVGVKSGGLVWQRVGSYKTIFSGSSYGLVNGKIPVFVIVGDSATVDSHVGSIYASHDGINWSNVYTLTPIKPEIGNECYMFSVVWDGTAFWAGGHRFENRDNAPPNTDGDPKMYEIDMLFRSSDGFNWGEAGSRSNSFDTSNPDAGWSLGDYETGLLNSHCSSRVVDSSNNNNVPDGVYGYDPGKLLVRPEDVPSIDYFFGGVGYSFPQSSGIVIINEGAGVSYPVGSPGFPVYCVARAGGAYAAGGGVYAGPGDSVCNAAVMVPSVEPGGVAWISLDPPGKGPITTMAGGEAKAPPLKA
jgi:hypothetical protein